MKVSSRIENLALINSTLAQLTKEYHIGEKPAFRILSAVNEAFTNAIIHGNQCDPSKYVTFQHRFNPPDELIFTLTDDGDGFNWRRAACLPENREKEGGRGLYIIEQFSDKHCFNKKGNRIELHFTL